MRHQSGQHQAAQHQKAKNEKRQHVIDCALRLMRDVGNHGLTMRKLATEAQMSLSNVQHYFAKKPDLLGHGGGIFRRCSRQLREQLGSRMGCPPQNAFANWWSLV